MPVVISPQGNQKSKDAKIGHLNDRLTAARRAEHELRIELDRTYNSISWRLTFPLRRANALFQRKGVPIKALRFAITQFRTSVRMFGLWKTLDKSLRFLSTGKFAALSRSTSDNQIIHSALLPPSGPSAQVRPATTFMTSRVLLIGEMSIPQCKKYRIDQKAEILSHSGIESTIVNWTASEEVRTQLQLHPIAIFYRVPAYPEVIMLIAEAKRLGVQTFWEVDDLIFDMDAYLKNKNLDSLDRGLRDSVLAGVPLYKQALLLCDAGIASTRTLAEVMTSTTGKPAYVIENALDSQTIAITQMTGRPAQMSDEKDLVTIVYGSGSKAHNSDFLEASTGILNVLKKRPNARFRIVGELEIDARFDDVSRQVDRLPFTNFSDYLAILSDSDISIAPLENTIFNDAKSNIKYLEASVAGLPSVCSPRDAFQSAIDDGRDGFLAATDQEWEDKLLRLVDDPALRKTITAEANARVLRDYSPQSIASRQVAPLIEKYQNRTRDKMRILIANIYFSPQSFGGATIVAEEMAERLAMKENVEVYVFTSWASDHAPDYSILRYSAKGATVISLKLPTVRTKYTDIEDSTVGDIFKQVLGLIKPNVVHLHSVQMLGIGLASACSDMQIPYAITLHDAWWLCERQFMVTGEHKYCFQTKISPAICATCVPDRGFNQYRTEILRWELDQANSLISPSEFFKNLHIQNGILEDRIFVNKNGVTPPAAGYSKKESTTLRFGYVGGVSPIKGFDLILKAFAELPKCDIELIMVDNTLNLGYSSLHTDGIKANNPIRIVPSYTQDTMDDFFSEIDVLLFPTQWKESFGLTVREALIRDVWVIASDAGGVVEDISAGENGEIIPISRSSEPLQRAMETCIQNRQKLRRFINPYKANIQTFDDQADELYRHLLGMSTSTQKWQ